MALYKDAEERRRVFAELAARRKRRDDWAEAVASRSLTTCCHSSALYRSHGKIVTADGGKVPVHTVKGR